ncbi:MAG: electron transport complex subunit RsxC [Lachnospiraceae bacterium]|nr:electron transport complex subunit RsxC [Lachnospiraceae bacterium]
MKSGTFKGGVHPWDGKELSKDAPVRVLEPGAELVYPMSQHIGAPAVPCVKKGDRVLKGQRVGEASGFMSANIHASVSGKVKAVEERLTAGGTKVMSVVVTNDGEYEEALPLETSETGEKEKIRDLIRQAGVVGMGGATFPVHVKLSPKSDDAIEYVILNGAECEPYLTSDYRRMLDDAEKIVRGLEIILALFGKAKGIIAIEDNKPDCVKRMTDAANGHDRITVVPVKTKYPQGGERTLIFATTGRKINSDMLPSDVGCIVNNVNTAYEVYRAVDERRPLTERLFTVTGDAAATPGNFLVPLGMSHKEVAEQAGGFNCEPEKLISGGPMMGVAMYTLDTPVARGTGSILAYKEDPVKLAEQQKTNCINCGRCVQVCPGRVIPSRLADFALQKNRAMFEKYYGMECCECGCCSFICPAKRDLTQSIKNYRREILALRKAERAKK